MPPRTPEEMAAAFDQGFEQRLGTEAQVETEPLQAEQNYTGLPYREAGRMALDYGIPAAGTVAGGLLGALTRIPGGAKIGAGIGGAGGSMLADLLLGRPVSKLGAGIQGATGGISGPAGSSAIQSALRAVRTMRSPAKELAREAISARMMTPEAEAAQQFYRSSSLRTSAFDTMHESLQALRSKANFYMKRGATGVGTRLNKQADELEGFIEIQFPGFKEAQKGYFRASSVKRARQLTELPNPLEALERDIVKGEVRKGKIAHGFSPAEQEEIKDILTELGPKPADNIWKKLIYGHAVGAAVGPLVGASAYAGGAYGGIGTLAGSAAINHILAAAIKRPEGRAFLKRSMKGGGLARPETWQILGSLVTRLGTHVVNPQEQPE